MKLAKNDRLIKSLLKKKIIQVNNKGEVLGQKLDIHGYYVIHYKGRNLKCHRISFEHFYGSLKPSMQVNHIDGNKKNNTKENLELITRSENIKHMFRTVKRAKLNRRIAGYIRRSYSSGKWSQSSLAAKYKCSTRLVQHIIYGTRYK